ncbi:TonB family protein [Calditrichota bacterium]
MIRTAEMSPSTWRSSLVIAFSMHILIVLVFGFGAALPKRTPKVREVTLIRMSGGGENIPGWIKPTTLPSDKAKVPDQKPQADIEPPRELHIADEANPAEPKSEPEEEEAHSETVGEEIKEEIKEEIPAVTGEGVGAKPGPEGAGWGIKTDADFPGGDAYLSRVEAEVQRRFNFDGRGSGAVAEYHFNIEKNGKMTDLILMKSSSIASLDLAARSAIVKTRFAPLPGGFGHEKLGITFRFYDAN